MHSMAVKIDISNKCQEKMKETLINIGYTPQSRKFHCTIGFIENMIPEEEVQGFGDRISPLLQEHISEDYPLFQVGDTAHLFGRVVAFLPNEKSKIQLAHLNRWLKLKIRDLSEGRFELNPQTQPECYTPHMTVWHARRMDSRFDVLKKWQVKHTPSYVLSQASCVVF